MIASVVINDMERTAEAAYGFRSWMLQDIDRPYEVVLNLFNDQRARFVALSSPRNDRCNVRINTFPPPRCFNISVANNIGLHFAGGEYVLFANSDIVYPSGYLRTVIDELSRRQIAYAVGARINLTARQTASLQKPEVYGLANNLDGLVGLENCPGNSLMLGLSPWIAMRSVAEAIGGFDPAVLCHEDSEFNDRIMHYLRRTGRQDCLYCIADRYGYHLHHPASELYHSSADSKAILESRRLRLAADPASREDVVPTDLTSLDRLLEDLLTTKTPEVRKGAGENPLMRCARRMAARLHGRGRD